MENTSAHPSAGSKHRVEALADGVFAIAMTLLVLELKVPELSHSAASSEIWQAIRAEGPVFFSFLVTFILSGAFWYQHQLLLHELKAFRGALIPLNILFLMFVSVLPFSTAMLGHYLRRPFAQEIYFANQFILGVLLLVQFRVAVGSDLLLNPDSENAKELSWRLLVFPIGAALAMAIALVMPDISFYGFLLAVLVIRIIRLRRTRATRKTA